MSTVIPEPLTPSFPTAATQIQALEERLNPISAWGRSYSAGTQNAIAAQQAREAEEQARLEAEQRVAELERQRKEMESKFADYESKLDKKGGSTRSPSGGGDTGDYSDWQPTSSMQRNAISLIESSGAEGARYDVLKYAAQMLGTPYAWGGGGYGVKKSRGIGKGTTNVIGVDCSGLTSYIYGKVGIKLPRYSNHQTSVGVKTNFKNAQPGDLVGWNRGGHVAVYVGNGYIIESPRPGKRVQLRRVGSNEGVYAVRLKFK